MHSCTRTTVATLRFLSVLRFQAPVRRLAGCALVAAVALGPAAALAAPTLGFIEEFPGVSNGTWSGGTPSSNPGTGGYLGAGDGYLLLESGASGNFGAVSFGSEYSGNWTAAGITQVRIRINDVGADDALELHFSLGDGNSGYPTANFWQYDVGFIPPLHAWGEYVVSLTTPADWTRLIGNGTLASALTAVDRAHIRHDRAPFLPNPNPPDAIAADAGIDHILLTNGLVGVAPTRPRATHPVELAPPYPNPSRGPVSLAVHAADSGPIRIEIVDVSGRSVRRIELGDSGEAPRTWLWDGRDDAGRQVSAGYYRVRASGTSGGMSRPIVRVD